MTLQQLPTAGERYRMIAKVLFFFIIAVYLVDCFTPMRLHVDTIRYYLIKDCFESGCPPDSEQAHDYFPYGFTALLLILSKLGILKSFTIVLVNNLYVFGGLYLLHKIFKKRFTLHALFILVLFNWLMVKYVAHPLSEMQYIFFSLAGIYYYQRFTEQKKFLYLLAALVLAWVAFMTRTIGITLIGGMAVGIIWEYRVQQLNFFRKNKVLVIGILAVLAVALFVFSKILGLDHYTGVLNEHFKEASFLKRVGWRFKEWGEIFVNTPSNKIIDRLAGKPGEIAFIAFGVIVMSWFFYTLFSRKSQVPFFLKAYLVFYSLLLFNWPFNDPRFWVPVMPVMAAVILSGDFSNKIIRLGSRLLLVIYIALGTFAAGYMVYTSFNKDVFVRNQAKGVYRNEYETHFYGQPQSDTATKVNREVVDILRRHD